MQFIDTHSHLYLEQFDADRAQVVERAIEKGVSKIFLPNIDSGSAENMLALCRKYPDNCYPVMGLHPTSVKEDFEDKLQIVDEYLDKNRFYGIGETGIDLYWDKTRLEEQIASFKHQIRLAKKLKLPIIIHVRNSFDEVFNVLDDEGTEGLTGIFHCFSGNLKQAHHALEMGFHLGINGVITYKNSGLVDVISNIGTEKIVLETDAPFLSPVPNRGKRNESAYIPCIAEKISDICGMHIEDIARITTANAMKVFNTAS